MSADDVMARWGSWVVPETILRDEPARRAWLRMVCDEVRAAAGAERVWIRLLPGHHGGTVRVVVTSFRTAVRPDDLGRRMVHFRVGGRWVRLSGA